MSSTASAGIVVIGADSYFSYLIRRYGRTSACQIWFADPGEDVLAIVRGKKPDVIILGAGIPDALRRDILHAFKVNHATRRIPIILCSWQDEAPSVEREGVDCYLRMPILYEDFVAALTQVGVLASV